MKKQAFFLAVLLLGLSSCGNSSANCSSLSVAPSSSVSSVSLSSSSSVSSEESSVIKEKTAEDYIVCLDTPTDYYQIKSAFHVKKDGVDYHHGIDYKIIDIANKVEHLYGNLTTVSSYEDPSNETFTSYDIYKTPSQNYTMGNDGKYVTTSASNTFAPYRLAYDFTKASDLSLTAPKGYSLLAGKVTAANLSAFIGNDKLSGVTDFSFVCEMTILEGYLRSIVFSYTDNGYSVTDQLNYSSLPQSISLPTV
jgi:hypothetical protein